MSSRRSNSNTSCQSSGTSRRPDTYTNTTTSPAPAPKDLTQGEKCNFLLQALGYAAQNAIDKRPSDWLGNPRLDELTKLSTNPPTGFNWRKATATRRPRHDYEIEWFKQYHSTEKVFRVWIPSDPDENPNLGNATHVRTVHNKHRAQIVRMVEDQLENTRKIFDMMRKHKDRWGEAMSLPESALAEEKMHHTVLALRLSGVEVCEYWEKYDRMEVFFEEPNVKLGMFELSPGVWR